jgi:hypothetical protein
MAASSTPAYRNPSCMRPGVLEPEPAPAAGQASARLATAGSIELTPFSHFETTMTQDRTRSQQWIEEEGPRPRTFGDPMHQSVRRQEPLPQEGDGAEQREAPRFMLLIRASAPCACGSTFRAG